MVKRPQIVKMPPGPKARAIVKRDTKVIATTTKTSPIAAVKGRGIMVEDVDGNTYYDFSAGIGVTNVGHCHPAVTKAIREQAGSLVHFAGTDFYYDAQVRLAERLTRITPGKKAKKVFYTNSGAESNEAALKIAKVHRKVHKFISFTGAFHGRTMGAVSLTGSKPVQKAGYYPTMPGVVHIPYAYCYRCPYKMEYPSCDVWCAKILDELYFNTSLPPSDVAAMFFEPVQGEGGYIVPPKKYVQTLFKTCKKHKILIVDDEVQAGMGRTGKFCAIEHHGVEADIYSFAKGMGSGMPIGASVFDAKLDFPRQGMHSNTYGGNLVASASALATLDVIVEENLLSKVEKVGGHFKKRLFELQERHPLIGDVRGLGLMLSTEFVKDPKTKAYARDERDVIVEEAYKMGLILLPCGNSGIRYIPPLIVTRPEVDVAVEILEKAIVKAEKKKRK